MSMTKESAESEMVEHEGVDDVRFKDIHSRIDSIEKSLGIGKHAPKDKTPMERMKERKRHT
jgi:hypothetical protein